MGEATAHGGPECGGLWAMVGQSNLLRRIPVHAVERTLDYFIDTNLLPPFRAARLST